MMSFCGIRRGGIIIGLMGVFVCLMPYHRVMAQNIPKNPLESCPKSVLDNLKRHVTIDGETVASIANQYALVPTTILSLNPNLQNQPITAGMVVLIPPYNGIRVNVPSGATWKDLGAAYGVRADVLFELNGCQQPSTMAFIPGVNWTTQGEQRKIRDYTGLSGYPLPFLAQVGLSYGWHLDPQTQSNVFHSGVDLLADIGTPVLVTEEGTVIFKGNEGGYGFLVIIDHGGGRQTRYAHLSKITVDIGQTVKTGDILGNVGISGQPDIKDPHLHFEVRYQLPVGWVAQDPMIHLSLPTQPGNSEENKP